MEIINKSHKEIKGYVSRALTVRIKNRGVYFGSAAMTVLKLKMGDKLNFINDGKQWWFHKTASDDGFHLSGYGKQKGLMINNNDLLNLIRKRTGFLKLPYSFYITKTDNEREGDILWEIDTAKPIELIGK
jgi:hypothetical protein